MDLQGKEELYLKAKKSYYDGVPIMEDFEFDELEQELKDLSSDVTSVVGDDRTVRYPHLSSVLSLAKIQATLAGDAPVLEFEKWYQGLCDKLGTSKVELEATPKFDGNSVNIQYKNGKRKRALTRGNEKGGKDVTPKSEHFAPETISYLGDCEVRGEVQFDSKVFQTKYGKAELINQAYKNPRNFIAGVLNNDDLDLTTLDDTVFIAYNFRKYDGHNKFVSDEIDFINSLGFNKKFDFLRYSFNDPKKFQEVYDKFSKYRESINYNLDGIVISVKDAEQRQEIGENKHDPDYALAVKFPPKQAKTLCYGLEWNMSNFGEMVPVALLNPVDLDGSVVKRASLTSWGNLQTKRCFPGSEVIVAKAGDIIPHIYTVVSEGDSNFEYPKVCSCGIPFTIDDKHITCFNVLCEEQVKRRFGSIMEILGYYNFGGATMELFFKAGLRTPADFFSDKMNKSYLISTGIFVEGRFLDRLFEELGKIKELPLQKLIESFRFNGVGTTASRELAKQISGQEFSFTSLERAPLEGFMDLTNPKRILLDELLQNLRDSGVKIIEPKTVVGRGLELTGSPKSFGFSTKEEFLKIVGEFGFVNKKLKDSEFLITDNLLSNSGKMKEAQKQGAIIITYGDFIEKYATNDNS